MFVWVIGGNKPKKHTSPCVLGPLSWLVGQPDASQVFFFAVGEVRPAIRVVPADLKRAVAKVLSKTSEVRNAHGFTNPPAGSDLWGGEKTNNEPAHGGSSLGT